MKDTPLRIVIVGHVDHGKSTLIGRLLYETNSLPEGKVEYVQEVCKRRGVPFEWAFVMDALQAERNQNVTIDSAQIWFRSATRSYVFIDAPGHREFLKNMITGAASADVALVLLAADEGIREQSRRHAYLLRMLGIKHIAVLVNKMDAVSWDRERFDSLVDDYRKILAQLDLEVQAFIPISARTGSQLVTKDLANLSWFEGPTVLEVLEQFDLPPGLTEMPLRFPIQDIYRFDERRILAGRIEAGTLALGDELCFGNPGSRSRIHSIETWNEPAKTGALAGQSIGITLEDPLFIERGVIATHPSDFPTMTRSFAASIFWMGKQDLNVDQTYRLKLTTQEVDCRITSIERVINAGTLETSDTPRQELHRDDVAHVRIETAIPCQVDLARDFPTTGRFVLVDGYDISGGGIITQIESEVSQDLHPATHDAIPSSRHQARHGHRSALISLPHHCSPERATELERELFDAGLHCWFALNPKHLNNSAELLLHLGFIVLFIEGNYRPPSHLLPCVHRIENLLDLPDLLAALRIGADPQ